MEIVLKIELDRPLRYYELDKFLEKVRTAVPLRGEEGIIIAPESPDSLPPWLYVVLVDMYRRYRPWIAVYDPEDDESIVVAVEDPDVEVYSFYPMSSEYKRRTVKWSKQR